MPGTGASVSRWVMLGALIAGCVGMPAVTAAQKPGEGPVLRQLEPGETRALGSFVGVVCERRLTVIAVRTQQGLLRLRQNPARAPEYIAYVPNPPSTIGCGPIDPPRRVLATYTTEGRLPSGIQGDAVAIEFIPPNYTPP